MSSPDEHELTDDDFIPRNEADPVETLRQYIRQRLRSGATQREVEDELTKQGLDPTYAMELTSSVRTAGQPAELEVGVEFIVNGASAGFFKNPMFERKLRLMKRQQRQQREACEDASEPNPALAFGAETSPKRELDKYRSSQRSRLLLIAGAVALVLLALVAYLLGS
jgi:hypothetical protein